MAEDRIGIIADVAAVVQDLQGNLGELSQTVVNGYFTMIFFAGFPDSVAESDLRAALEQIDPANPLQISLRQSNGAVANVSSDDQQNRYILTATGADRLGLVARLTSYLRQRQINIIDQSNLVSDGVYIMILVLSLPADSDVVRLKRSLQAAAKEMNITVELQHHEIFRVTNEV